MVNFQPTFSLWPRPALLGDSGSDLAAWMIRRIDSRSVTLDVPSIGSIRQIIEAHHDLHARTIYPLN